MTFLETLRRFDWILFCAVTLLAAIGLLSLASSSGFFSGGTLERIVKQLAVALAGMVVLFVLAHTDYRLLRSYSPVLYGVLVALLAASLLVGTRIRGAQAWVVFGSLNFEPAEIAKVLLPVMLAYLVSRSYRTMSPTKLLLTIGGVVALPVAMMLAQPDLGSALLFIFLFLGTLLVIGLPRRHLALIALLAVFAGLLAWLLFLAPYQKERIVTFLDPSRDPLGSGYQLRQAVVAVGSGSLAGRGIGLGPQSQLQFLPESASDFAFAKIAEEMGILGASFVLLLFFLMLARFVVIARAARDDFGSLVAGFLALLFFVQIVINIGMNLAILPITGITLPFISRGGSSLLASLAATGILESIWVHRTARLSS